MKQALVLLSALVAASPGWASDQVFVVTSDQAAFTEAARAALDVVGSSGRLLRADESAKDTLAQAGIVIAVGPLAARLVSSSAPSSRMVGCLVPRQAAAQAVAVPLQAAPADVLGLVRQLLPTAATVGVFPSPGRASAELAAAASSSGLRLEMPQSGESFTSSVERLLDNTDVVWIDDLQSIPDGGAALVVKAAAEQSRPVIGPNRGTVLQGAFFAVVPDPAEHGRAAGEVARLLLKGESVKAVSAPPGKVIINGALARTAGIKLSPALARRAELVE